jgi:peptide/nickel transport system permease protein
MAAFVVRRLLISIPVLFASSILVFLLVANSGDPLGELRARQPPVPPEVIAQRERDLNLDKSQPERYLTWLAGMVRGDMGKTIDGREVGPLLFDRLQITLRMVLLASLIALLLAVVVGVVSAVRQYTALDYTSTFTGFLFLSMPVFWLAALLKEYVGIGINQAVGRQLIFTVGEQTPNLTGDLWTRIGDYLGHLILPTIALAAISYAAWSRYQRASMLDVLNSDYIRLARAKGLSSRRVMVRHALRNALIPLTTVVAIDFGAVFGGAVITEQVFTWQGMGQLLVAGVRTHDVNIMLAWLVVSASMVVLFNLIADILYAYLDPRIRYG